MADDRIRLQKYLAERGVASRRQAAELVRCGRIRVNEHTIRVPGHPVDPRTDRVALDGTPLPAMPEPHCTVALNKPRGYICSRSSRQGRTVFDLIEDKGLRLVPVGRLDKDSEGLLLLSNDGRLIHDLTHPRGNSPKVYRVSVQGVCSPAVLRRLNAAMIIDGKRTRPAQVTVHRADPAQGHCVLECVLHEGRNRQIRKMCALAGLRVTRLVRIRIRNLGLGDLRSGEWRQLDARETADLYSSPPPATVGG